MKLPNKAVTYEESILSKLPFILSILEKDRTIQIGELYNKTKKKFDALDEFFDVVTCLYSLNKIELDEEYGVIHYVI